MKKRTAESPQRIVALTQAIPRKTSNARGGGRQQRMPGNTQALSADHSGAMDSTAYHSYGRKVAGMATLPPRQTEALESARDADDGLVVGETFADYIPAKLKIGLKHPDHVVETTSMRSVPPPNIKYKIGLPKAVIDNGLLSALQLEAVTYACQQHETFLQGERAGFLIGDGAGVGKGRTIAGIIYENWLRDRKKAIWFSVSPDLKVDAERDLSDIGADFIKVHRLSGYQKLQMNEGVIFSTFSGLIGKTSVSKANHFKTRLDQLVAWCGKDFDGVIVFDECHRAKNLFPDKKQLKSTKTGQTVKDIQDRLPGARVVYASATGATEPRNMGYMVRLGLWGPLTPFDDFHAFMKSIDNRGVGAMELVAMEMKHRGMYISRHLSFSGVTFSVEEVKLEQEFIDVYDASVKFWIYAEKKFKDASALAGLGRKRAFVMILQFWGCHQRFFKYLCLSAKINAAVHHALKAVRDGKCAVIGLQSTGEAKTNQMREAMEAAGGELNEFISTSRAVVMSLFNQFPTKVDFDDKVTGRFKFGNDDEADDDLDDGELEDLINERQDELEGNGLDPNFARADKPEVERRLEKMKLEMIGEFEKFAHRLPANMLDTLIEKLGGPTKVAEMTGRKGRMISDQNGKILYEKRDGKDDADSLNIAEKDRFMDGKKLIAVISEAASSGISLQADRRVPNQRRRVHITLELAWSADRVIQQFGRTHRSNQTSAPEYIFLISDVAGEKRFASVVAQRLERLGALTQGDRRATESRDLSMFNVDTKYGRQALSKMMNTILRGHINPTFDVPAPPDFQGDFIQAVRAALTSVGVLEHNLGTDSYKFGKTSNGSLKLDKFMNRILGVPIRMQNAVFQYFADTLDRVIDMAKKEGKFDLGTMELGKSGAFAKLEKRIYYTQKDKEHSKTYLYNVVCDRGLTFEHALEILTKNPEEMSGFYSYYPPTGGNNPYIMLVVPSPRTISFSKGYKQYDIYRPNSGRSGQQQTYFELRGKQDKRVCDLNRAKTTWDRFYAACQDTCYHRYLYGKCDRPACTEGSRAMRTQVLSGSVLGIWRELESVFDGSSVYHVRTMQIVRVIFNNSRRIIGIQLPHKGTEAVMKAIGDTCGNAKDDTAEAMIEMAIEDDCRSVVPYRPAAHAMLDSAGKAYSDPNAPSTSRIRSPSVSFDLSSSDTDNELDKRSKKPIKKEVKKEEPSSQPLGKKEGPEPSKKANKRTFGSEKEEKQPVLPSGRVLPKSDKDIEIIEISSGEDEPWTIKLQPPKKPDGSLLSDDDDIICTRRPFQKVLSLDTSDEDEPKAVISIKKPANIKQPAAKSAIVKKDLPISVQNALTPLRLKSSHSPPPFAYRHKPKVISLLESSDDEQTQAKKPASKAIAVDSGSTLKDSAQSVKENCGDVSVENLDPEINIAMDIDDSQFEGSPPPKKQIDADADFITRGIKRMLSG